MNQQIVLDSQYGMGDTKGILTFSLGTLSTIRACKVRLLSLVLPNTLYNVSKDESFAVGDGTTSTTVSITPGAWTATAMSTAINTALSSSNVSCSIDPQTFRMAFASTTPAVTLDLTNLSAQTRRMFGFSNVTYSQASPVVGESPVNFDPFSMIYISVQQLPNPVVVPTGTSSSFKATFAVPLSSFSGSTRVYEFYEQQVFLSSSLFPFQQFNVVLLDSSGTVLSLQSDYVLVLEFS